MKHNQKRRLALACAFGLGLFTSPAQAQPTKPEARQTPKMPEIHSQQERFQETKTNLLHELDTYRACVSAAEAQEDMRACRKARRELRIQQKLNRLEEQKQRLAERERQLLQKLEADAEAQAEAIKQH